MPIFEYTCNDCGSPFELLVRGDTGIACEKCGSTNVKKGFSAFAVGAVRGNERPECAAGCDGGYSRGRCGSGMCPGE